MSGTIVQACSTPISLKLLQNLPGCLFRREKSLWESSVLTASAPFAHARCNSASANDCLQPPVRLGACDEQEYSEMWGSSHSQSTAVESLVFKDTSHSLTENC